VEIVRLVTKSGRKYRFGQARSGRPEGPREIPRPTGKSAGLRDDACNRPAKI
jgi:hypothetical protein